MSDELSDWMFAGIVSHGISERREDIKVGFRVPTRNEKLFLGLGSQGAF